MKWREALWYVINEDSLPSDRAKAACRELSQRAEKKGGSFYLVAPLSLAAKVKEYIPDAVIEFGDKPSPFGMGRKPLNVTSKAAKEDFGFECMSLDEGVKIHINDARMDAGMELMQF